MDREEALDRLPVAYAKGLRLRQQGRSEETIAELLEISVEAVGPLLQLAERKLTHLLREPTNEAAPRRQPQGEGEI